MEFPSGPGRIVACEIHNNFGRGVNILATAGKASFRTVRSVLWNNNMEGWLATIADNLNHLNVVACPVVFCTFAGNGDDPAADANIAVKYSTNAYPFFGLHGPFILNPPLMHTKFLHNIFARKHQFFGSGGGPDFGGVFGEPPRTPAKEEKDNPLFPNSAPDKIYMAGNRSGEDLLGISGISSMGRWTSFESYPHHIVEFEGGPTGTVIWTEDDAKQFRLLDTTGDGLGNNADDAKAGHIINWLGELLLPSSEYDTDLLEASLSGSFTGIDYNAGVNFISNKGAFVE